MSSNKSVIAMLVLLASQGVFADPSVPERSEVSLFQELKLNEEAANAVEFLLRTGVLRLENGKLILKQKSVLEKLKAEGRLKDLPVSEKGTTICA